MSDWAPWLWLAAGLFVGAAEALAPGVFLLWLGLAAVGTGAVLFAAPLQIEWQVLVFCGLAALSVAVGRRLYGSWAAKSGSPLLNRRAEALVGRLVLLHDPIRNGEGSARVGDTIWLVSGPDLPAGTRVRVVGVVDANRLVVAAAD